MGRLRTAQSRLTAPPPRIGLAPTDTAGKERERVTLNPLRALYKTARWAHTRERILKRDGYTCQATGVLLVGKHPEPSSPVVDHKRPHRGDERLFWDEHNLWAVSKAYHDGEKQRQEQAIR